MVTEDVQKAVAAAKAHLTAFYQDAEDVRLEEVVVSDDDRFYDVTVSALLPFAKRSIPEVANPIENLRDLFSPTKERTYKVFRVDRSGEVKSMRMRIVNE